MAYWLFKTEPQVFGIDDLAAIHPKSEPWDGIRNYQARNLLRDQVAEGDEVFIYHSSCAQVGIAGLARVASAAYVDPDQFDPESKYYDPKAEQDTPRWYRVDVVYQRTLDKLIPLKLLKQQEALVDMVLLKQGRLSVQPVRQEEWDYILTHLA